MRKNACKEIEAFFKDQARPATTTFFLAGKYEVNLVRVFNQKSKCDEVYATSLPMEILRPAVIRKLYSLRWEVEVSFLELTAITNAEHWHSKTVNGIYQELYARFWLINYTKLQIQVHSQKPDNPLRAEYQKPNFKLLYNFILMSFQKLLKGNRQFIRDFSLLKKSHSRGAGTDPATTNEKSRSPQAHTITTIACG